MLLVVRALRVVPGKAAGRVRIGNTGAVCGCRMGPRGAV